MAGEFWRDFQDGALAALEMPTNEARLGRNKLRPVEVEALGGAVVAAMVPRVDRAAFVRGRTAYRHEIVALSHSKAAGLVLTHVGIGSDPSSDLQVRVWRHLRRGRKGPGFMRYEGRTPIVEDFAPDDRVTQVGAPERLAQQEITDYLGVLVTREGRKIDALWTGLGRLDAVHALLNQNPLLFDHDPVAAAAFEDRR